MKIGDPPTDLNARTGLFTPPGINFCDVSHACSDLKFFATFPSSGMTLEITFDILLVKTTIIDYIITYCLNRRQQINGAYNYQHETH